MTEDETRPPGKDGVSIYCGDQLIAIPFKGCLAVVTRVIEHQLIGETHGFCGIEPPSE